MKKSAGPMRARYLLAAVAVSLSFALVGTAVESRDRYRLDVDTKQSLIRVGVTPMNVTSSGLAAAECVYDAIESNNIARAEEAIEIYDRLLTKENLGGDYSGLQWICRNVIAMSKGTLSLPDRVSKEYWDYLSKDAFAELKEYLQRKYGLRGFFPEDLEVHNQRRAFLEDFVMFMNPRREEWERSRSIIPLLDLKEGETVADIGSGLGWYTFLMADEVGDNGLVYAIDLNEKFLDYVNGFSERQSIKNIKTIASSPTDIMVEEKVDVAVMCSLYHVIYGWSPEKDRRAFVLSILESLKPDGRLVIVDNLAATGRELHSCYVNHEFVAAQFHHYGLEVDLYAEVSPLRYVLILKRAEALEKPVLPPLDDMTAKQDEERHGILFVESANSLVHIGSLDSFDTTEGGTEAAKKVLTALEEKDLVAAQEAILMYDKLIPNENFGGEYTALRWFCQHMLAEDKDKEAFFTDALTRAYFNYLADGDYALLIDYVKHKYKLAKPGERSPLDMPPPHKDEAEADDGGQPPQGVEQPAGEAGQPPPKAGLLPSERKMPTQTTRPTPKVVEPSARVEGEDRPPFPPRAPEDGEKQLEDEPPEGTEKDSHPGKRPPRPPRGGKGGKEPGKDLATIEQTGEGPGPVKPSEEAVDPNVGRTRRAFLEDFILFNNPERPNWEKTDKIMALLDITEGDRVADIGCGSGFFTFRFAKMVGEAGRVFAIDIKPEHLEFMDNYMDEQGITNVVTVHSQTSDVALDEPVDCAYMCSLYHIIYGVAPEADRHSFLQSIKRILKRDGVFYIVDNGPVENTDLPYHGPYIVKELVIAQLEQYGFKFEAYHQIIPQRYLLKFRHVAP